MAEAVAMVVAAAVAEMVVDAAEMVVADAVEMVAVDAAEDETEEGLAAVPMPRSPRGDLR